MANVLGALVTAASIAPAVAGSSGGPGVGVWIDLHFVRANGQTKTITEPVNLPRAGAVNGYCSSELPADRDIAHGAFLAHPDLAGMTFVGATCETDKNGQIRVATGAWPAGQGPTLTPIEQHNAAVAAAAHDHPPDQFATFSKNAANPAAVLLTYKLITGKTETYIIAPNKNEAGLEMSTCPAHLDGLLLDYKNRVLRAVNFPGGDFVSAKCIPMAHAASGR